MEKIILLIRALRCHQWVKNILLFVPAVMAHRVFDPEVFTQAFLSFLSFSFLASAVYVVNDLADIEADRLHPSKSKRPFASGKLPLNSAYFLIPFLLVLTIISASFLNTAFYQALSAYFIMTLVYTFLAKKLVMLDVMFLAGLYTVRIIAGGLGTSIPVSNWLLVFSMFIFLSLACAKRYAELKNRQGKISNDQTIPGRGYLLEDLETLSQFGTSSGFISVLVLGLYITSPDVKHFYASQDALWLICPLLLYWLSRLWVKARRGDLNEDPIVYALKDSVSYILSVIVIFILLIAS